MREDVIRAHAELPSAVRAHPPAAAVRLEPILKAMRRTYNRERYLERVALIREHVPGLRDHDRHHRRLPGRDRGGLRADARGGGAGPLRRRLHVHLLAAARHRGGGARRAGPARAEARADGAAREAGAAHRDRARAALRRAARWRCWSRAPSRTDPRQAARPHAPQQDRQLPRARAARRARAGGDHARRRAPRWPARSCCSRGRSLEHGPYNRDLRSHRRSARRRWRSSWPTSCARAARIRSRSRPTRCRSTSGLGDPDRRRGRRGAGAAGAPPDRLRARHADASRSASTCRWRTRRSTPRWQRGGGRSWSAAPASTCAPRSRELDLRPAARGGAGALDPRRMDRRGPGGAARGAARARAGRWRGSRPATATASSATLELLEMGELEPDPAATPALDRGHAQPTLLAGLVDGPRASCDERIDARMDAMVAAGGDRRGARAPTAAGASRTARKALGFEDLLARRRGGDEAPARASSRAAS